jgi:hypothetical protein
MVDLHAGLYFLSFIVSEQTTAIFADALVAYVGQLPILTWFTTGVIALVGFRSGFKSLTQT